MRGTADGRSGGTKGFTLVELMVVLVIFGLAAAAVVLTLPEPGGSLGAEAERFAARAKAAHDNAILDSRPATLTVGPDGYEISRRTESAHYDWVEGTEAALAGGSEGRIRFSATGLADPAQLVLRRHGRAATVDIGGDGNVRIRR